MRNASSSTGGDLLLCTVFGALSIVAGALVVTFVLVVTSPIVAMFPPDSGAGTIVTTIAMMWGVVVGCVVAVYTIGPWRRLHSRAQIERIDDAAAVPLEMIGRPVPRRRVANDARTQRVEREYAYAETDDAYADDAYADDGDELLLEEEAAPPRRRAAPAPQRYRRAS